MVKGILLPNYAKIAFLAWLVWLTVFTEGSSNTSAWLLAY